MLTWLVIVLLLGVLGYFVVLLWRFLTTGRW